MGDTTTFQQYMDEETLDMFLQRVKGTDIAALFAQANDSEGMTFQQIGTFLNTLHEAA